MKPTLTAGINHFFLPAAVQVCKLHNTHEASRRAHLSRSCLPQSRFTYKPLRFIVEAKSLVNEPKSLSDEAKRLIVEPKRLIDEAKRFAREAKRLVVEARRLIVEAQRLVVEPLSLNSFTKAGFCKAAGVIRRATLRA